MRPNRMAPLRGDARCARCCQPEKTVEMGVAREGGATGDIAPDTVLAGRYRIQRPVGRGGMGTVYRALDQANGRTVALKAPAVHEDRRTAELQAVLFEREYHVLTQLSHPHVVRVFDYGVHVDARSERPFYTMELLESADLRSLLPLPWPRACAIARDVCSALALLHSRRLLHRDVGTRNVRLDASGAARLIDFGAMSTMGAGATLVGTPPAVPPEALHGDALDGRVDLYAVGALLYHMLTQRHAYRARRFRDLAKQWAHPPVPPSLLTDEVPEGLDALVLELLALDRNARPRTAAEVIERLTALAGLDRDEPEALSRAYLVTPSLIGRESELDAVHRAVRRLAQGEGGSVVIEGSYGLGRSRMLDGAVLAAQLAGVTALRVSAADLLSEPFSLARAMCATGLEVVQPEILEAAAPDGPTLGHVLPGLHNKLGAPPLAELPRHVGVARIQEALARLFRRLAAGRPLLLAIDDLGRADEASVAVLSMLATDPEGVPVLMAFTRDVGAAVGNACQLLCELASPIALRPLDADETEALLESVFGAVPGLAVTARWVHRLASGNPQKSMTLAQHLVDQGHARFSRGSWVLPANLEALSLPDSLEEALDAQVGGLGADARRLACLLVLSLDGAPLSLAELARVGVADTALDPLAVHAAMEELTERQIVSCNDGRVSVREGFEGAVRRGLDAATARRLHGLLARACSARGESDLVVVHHLQEAGEDAAALERIRPGLEPGRDPYVLDLLNVRHAELAANVLRRALFHAQSSGEPQRLLHALWLRINTLASMFDVLPAFDEPLALLRHDIGLDYHDADVEELDPRRRIERAIERARSRHEATAPAHRGVDPGTALVLYRQTVGRFLGRASATLDLPILRRARALLDPVLPLSPAFQLLHTTVRIADEGLRGLDVLPELEQVMRGRREAVEHGDARYEALLRMGLHYRLALEQARRGDPGLEHARFFDRDPATRDLAAAIEMFVNLNQGRVEEADRVRERLRALSARGFSRRILSDLLYNEVIVYSLIESIGHLKGLLDPVERMAARHRGWEPIQRVAHAAYDLHRGEPQLAIDQAEHVLGHVRPGEHLAWLIAMPVAVRAQIDAGRAEQGAARAREALASSRHHALHPLGRVALLSCQALAEATCEHARARGTGAAAEQAIERSALDGVPRASGLALCARAALAIGDRDAYERRLAALDRVCARAGGSALHVRADRGRVAAQARGNWTAAADRPRAGEAGGEPDGDQITKESR